MLVYSGTSLTEVDGGTGFPEPPTGFAYLVNADEAYILNADDAYILVKVP